MQSLLQKNISKIDYWVSKSPIVSHNSFSILLGPELKPEVLKTWAYSWKVCFEFFVNLEAVRDKYLEESKFSKDDMKDDISDDDVHRARLRSKVKLSIDVFNSDQHTAIEL